MVLADPTFFIGAEANPAMEGGGGQEKWSEIAQKSILLIIILIDFDFCVLMPVNWNRLYWFLF